MQKVLWIFLFFISISASSEESEDLRVEVANNVSSEYVTCAAYFIIVAEGMSRSGKSAAFNQYRTHNENALDVALVTAREGRTEEMAQKVTEARFEMFVNGMIEDLDNDISNMSIILNNYAKTCKFAMEKPDEFMTKIMDKVIAKYEKK